MGLEPWATWVGNYHRSVFDTLFVNDVAEPDLVVGTLVNSHVTAEPFHPEVLLLFDIVDLMLGWEQNGLALASG